MFDHLIQLQRKPEPKELDISYGKKAKDVGCRVKTAKEEWKEREAPTTQTVPTRIKIFEGGSVKILAIITLVISADSKHSGYIRMSSAAAIHLHVLFLPLLIGMPRLSLRYKSNEDYVYVRGRGRGKYICEECGIRCKKPSMLKKHIRTHTDVRPYICRVCNFAFKTKGERAVHSLYLKTRARFISVFPVIC